MIRLRRWMVPIVSLFMVISCGKQEDKIKNFETPLNPAGSGKQKEQNRQSSDDVVVVKKPMNIVKETILGTWSSYCDRGLQVAYIFEDKLFAKNYVFFEEAECNKVKYVIQFGGRYVLIGESAEEGVVNKLNAALEFAGLTLYNPTDVTKFNEQSILGYTDWKLQEGKNIIDKEFKSDVLNPHEMATTRLYTTMALKDGKLFVAEFAKSAEDRPESPTDKNVYIKLK